MKFYLHAYTPGPGGMLEHITRALRDLGHDAAQLPKNTVLSPEQIDSITGCDLLVLGGPDSDPPGGDYIRSQLRLIEKAISLGIKIVVIEDVPGSSGRPKIKSYAPDIECVLRSAGGEQSGADVHDFGYSYSTYIGPPPHWKATRDASMAASREDVRVRLRKSGISGDEPIAANDVVIFFSGIKHPPLINRILRGLVDAGRQVAGSHFVLYFREHPAEKPKEPSESASRKDREQYKYSLAIYNDTIEKRHEIMKGAPWVVYDPTGKITQAEAIKASDLFIATSGATDSLVVAHEDVGIVAGYYTDADVRKNLIDSGIKDGYWPPAELGGVYKFGPNNFEEAIRLLLSEEGKEAVRAKQRQNFPAPTTWDTAPKIATFLESLVK